MLWSVLRISYEEPSIWLYTRIGEPYLEGIQDPVVPQAHQTENGAEVVRHHNRGEPTTVDQSRGLENRLVLGK